MMAVSLLRWLALGSIFFWLLVYWQGGRRIIADIRKSIRASQSPIDAFLMGAMALLTLAMASTGLLVTLGVADIRQSYNSVTSIGALLALAGIVGTFYCRRLLGCFWTAETALPPEHQIVDCGPYRLVRHPIYTCAALLYLGLALIFPTWWNILAGGLVVAGYVLKALDEDRYLKRNLPGYQDYQRRVPHRLIPWLL
jgi:protein-S-isoprenylcysteine O-methyltransferase Ste14